MFPILNRSSLRAFRNLSAGKRSIITKSVSHSLGRSFDGAIEKSAFGNSIISRKFSRSPNEPPVNDESKSTKRDSAAPEDQSTGNSNSQDGREIKKFDYDDYDDWEDEPVTAKDKIRAYGRAFFNLALLAAIAAGSIYCLRELFPGRLGTYNLYGEAFESVKINDDVKAVVGKEMKAFGRDVGRNEGRRNQVDSHEYVAEDGSARKRIRFNVKGSKGHVLVWVEVSANMPSNEYVYLICQDRRTGRVITIQDNRARLDREMESNGGSTAGNDISQMLNRIFMQGSAK